MPDGVATDLVDAAVKSCAASSAREIPILRKPGQIQPARRGTQKRRKRGSRVVIVHRREISQPFRFGAAANWREDVDDSSATDGPLRGLVSNDQAVSVERADGPVEHNLHQARGARCDAGALENRDSSRDIRRAEMYVHRSPVGQRTQLACENPKTRIELLDGLGNVAGDHPITALDQFTFQAGAGQIDRAALPCAACRRGRVLRVNACGRGA